MWANVARAGAWAIPMKNGKESNYITAVLAELMTDERWYTRDECERLFQGSVSAAMVDRALHWMQKIGVVSAAGNSHFRLSGDMFADILRRVRMNILSEETNQDRSELYVCATCATEYSTLDAVVKLKTDEQGFFCTCGGDLHIKTREISENTQHLKELEAMYALIDQAEKSGELAPKPPRPANVTKRRPRDQRTCPPPSSVKQSRNL